MSACDQNGVLAEALSELTTTELAFIRYDWQIWARDDQLPPADEENELPWRTWVLLGGRGSGKTRAGAEWIRAVAMQAEQSDEERRIALVGKTVHDVRNVMIEGVSGLLAVHAASERPVFEPSKRRLTWPSGTVAEMYSADECEGLRGPQFSFAWCDELAKWRNGQKAWDMLQFALRLGDAPRAVVTTTPRPIALLKAIMADARSKVARLNTQDNAQHLAPAFVAEMVRRYANSDMARQELYGEIIEDHEAALWRRSWIDAARIETAPECGRTVVALDPPVTATHRSDACGIVVAGIGVDKRAYVIADRTIQGREPKVWAEAALAAYDDYGADALVVEVNQGGDLIGEVLRQFRRDLPISEVRATRGKWLRAEPVAALYAQGRVVHAGYFTELEDQMCAFGGDGRVIGRSPDRVDALVWAITELMLKPISAPAIRTL